MAWRIPAAVDLSRTIKDDGHMLSSPQPEILTFTLDTHAARLDAWLATACPLSPARWKQLIEAGHVQLNGAPILKPKTSLAPSIKLTCALPAPVTTELLPANIPLAILYEDSDLIAINKPAGWSSILPPAMLLIRLSTPCSITAATFRVLAASFAPALFTVWIKTPPAFWSSPKMSTPMPR